MQINEISLRYARALDSKSESEQLYHVKKGGTFIQYIADPSPKVQLAAITNDMYSIYYINNPSLEVLNKCKHEIIKYILENIRDNDITSYNDPIFDRLKDTEWPELQTIKKSLEHERKNNLTEDDDIESKRLYRVRGDGLIIQHFDNPSEAVQLAAVQQNWMAIQYIKNPSEEVQLAAVTQNMHAVKYITDLCEPVQLYMINQDTHNLSLIKHPTHTAQLAAVQKNGWALKYIKNIASSDVQLAAIKQNGYAIEHIQNPSEKLKIIAVKSTPMSIELIKRPSEEVQKAAINTNGSAMVAIEDHISDEVIHECKHAIIKGLLNCLKKGKFDYVKYMLTMLSNYTLNWPELEIIKRSFEHEIKKQS